MAAGMPVNPSMRVQPGRRRLTYSRKKKKAAPPNVLAAAFTGAVAQYVSDAQHLRAKDADRDEELRYDAQGPPQVLGGQFPQVHGHHVGRQTCKRDGGGGSETTPP